MEPYEQVASSEMCILLILIIFCCILLCIYINVNSVFHRRRQGMQYNDSSLKLKN
jgi:hypothetical protein